MSARSRKPKRTHRTKYGDGSFYWHPKLKVWTGITPPYLDENGKKKRDYVYNASEDQAWREFQQMRKDRESGALAPGTPRNKTVGDYMDDWLTERQHHVAPKTFATDKGQLEKWVRPYYGTRRLRDLSPNDIRRIAQMMGKAGKSTTTIRYTQGKFQQMMRDACREGYLVPQPFLDARRAGEAAPDRDAIPAKDVAKILAQARADGQEALEARGVQQLDD